MTGNDKTLRETVSEVIGEQVANSNSSNQSNQSGISKGQSGETQSGGTPEYVAGVDISDIPEQDRPRIKAKLEEKLKLIEKGYQPKFQKVAKLEKSLEWLTQQGISPEEAEVQLNKYVEQKKNPNLVTNEKKDIVKTLDKLISESPYEQKEALQNMRKIILEETNVDKLEKKIEQLERSVNYFQNKDMQLGENQLNSDIDSLKEKFGKDLIEKYEDTLRSEWRKYPQSKAKDILKYIVVDEEYEQALLSKSNRKSQKINSITSNGSGVTSSVATLDVKKTSLKDILTSVLKEKRG